MYYYYIQGVAIIQWGGLQSSPLSLSQSAIMRVKDGHDILWGVLN